MWQLHSAPARDPCARQRRALGNKFGRALWRALFQMWRHQPYAGEVLLLAIDLPPSSAAAAVIPIRGLGRTVSTLPAQWANLEAISHSQVYNHKANLHDQMRSNEKSDLHSPHSDLQDSFQEYVLHLLAGEEPSPASRTKLLSKLLSKLESDPERIPSGLPAEEVANGGRAASIPTEHNRPKE
ncbi:hypothetical protein PGT21_034071 [Puccinia graminis f. sp. tritici]|uniref:Uncharacterized protein n=1 Tax=Puccinia graminis f. sp. tritici TaxID=56615 RepID=A0A5B0QPR9_PUCGR|nr:hypothetical protein PGT21_034071 [Puccinia graminis f. sp. tritici]